MCASRSTVAEKPEARERAKWGNQLEFLMSCIAMSVGLGNVWRFPFVAYQNGGGAFLIPYIIVLFLIGKPMYYLECVIGQLSSCNSVKVWHLSPAMKGTGYAQILTITYMLSYYAAIVALCLYYLVMSFNAVLPWSVCQPEWGDTCVPSVHPEGGIVPTANAVSSAELYFVNTVLQQSDGIEGGIGAPIWYLSLALFCTWIMIFIVVFRGIKTSGKAAYFLAIFPYIVLIILLIRAATLPGAEMGIKFFLTPQWGKLLELSVWYAATTQVFFSLGVGTGALTMYASYNGFRTNIYRDSMIVTTLDTFTSLISGITIFGVLGHLAHELGYDNVSDVIGSGGTGLAFISYPEAIAKSPFVPQLFAVLFFLMMTVLGVGCGVATISTINTLLLDAFPRVYTPVVSAVSCTIGFAVGLVYMTPGGQYILELVDYGGTFSILFCAIAEIIGVFWIYGLENLCLDIEFMLERKTSMFWRLCWGLVTPGIMITVFTYEVASAEPLVFGDDYIYPDVAYAASYALPLVAAVLVPLYFIHTLRKLWTGNFIETFRLSFRPKASHGPQSPDHKKAWLVFKQEAKQLRQDRDVSRLHHLWLSLTGGYRRNL